MIDCWRVFEEIKSTSSLMEQLLNSTCQRKLFGKVMDRVGCIQAFGHLPIDVNVCVNGHELNSLITNRFFNCVAKNFAKDLNTNSQSRQSKKRKIAKVSARTDY